MKGRCAACAPGGANLTSFVSNVLTRSGEQRYRGEIQLGESADRAAASGRGGRRDDPVGARAS